MRRVCAVLLVALGTCVAAAPAASAATEFGDTCAATSEVSNYTFVSLSASIDPLPLLAPVSGVITQWRTNVKLAAPPAGQAEALTVLRPAAGSLQFTVVGQSAYSTINNGLNSFATRIPVQAGDHLGVAGANGAFYCETGKAGDAMGYITSVLGPGSSSTFTSAPGLRVAAMAVIEPDADGDGYGDETQDHCPQSALAALTACPVTSVSLSKVVKKRGVSVLVSTSLQAPVTVIGKVKVDGKKLILSGGERTVGSGKIVPFNLAFPTELKTALGELPATRALWLKVIVEAKNIDGSNSTKRLTVKLKGQG